MLDTFELSPGDWCEVLGLLLRIALIFVCALGFACLPLASVWGLIMILIKG